MIYVGVKMQPKWAEDNGIVKKKKTGVYILFASF